VTLGLGLSLVALAALSACAHQGPRPLPPSGSDPDAVRLITDDLARFWAAYDSAVDLPDPALRDAL